MENYSRVGYQVKGKISRFCGKIDAGLSKPRQKFVQQMIHGMISRRSVLLTEVVRSLPQTASFKKTHERLSLNLAKDGWRDKLEANMLEENRGRINQDTVIAVDISELTKRYAKRMEHLGWVRDGSDPEGKIKPGYWLLEAVGVNRERCERFPLLSWLYSLEADEFASENQVILAGFRRLREAFGDSGIYTFDRAGDRENIIKPLLGGGFRLVIRMIGTRNILVIKGKQERKLNLLKAAHSLRCRCGATFWSGRNKKLYRLSFGSLKIRLPFWDKELRLVVVKGLGNKPMMLLTTLDVRYRHELWEVVEIYLARWGVDEVIRFKKQAFDLENIRVLGYKSLQNMLVLLNAATMFLAYLESTCLKLTYRLKLLIKHHPRAEVIKLIWYHLIDGISHVLRHARQSLQSISQRAKPDRQLALPLKPPLTLEAI